MGPLILLNRDPALEAVMNYAGQKREERVKWDLSSQRGEVGSAPAEPGEE